MLKTTTPETAPPITGKDETPDGLPGAGNAGSPPVNSLVAPRAPKPDLAGDNKLVSMQRRQWRRRRTRRLQRML